MLQGQHSAAPQPDYWMAWLLGEKPDKQAKAPPRPHPGSGVLFGGKAEGDLCSNKVPSSGRSLGLASSTASTICAPAHILHFYRFPEAFLGVFVL